MTKTDVRLIAFYLPQFHPIPENDKWWGKGFTEWTAVSRAKSLFKGHQQPHLPADLGFYDLRLPETRKEQARLAREFGIYGFCYYYYWFAGRRLLERPLEEVFRSGQPELPFCICWANENWSRRWDGSENEILIGQEHSRESDERFIRDVIPMLKDRRYIRVNGAPLLIIYRVDLLPDASVTVDLWREICAKAGIAQLHVAAVQSFGITDPRPYGCDSAVEFPPHGIAASEISGKVEELVSDFKGKIYDYREVVQNALAKPKVPYPRFPGVMLGWDNTPRRGVAGHIYHHSSPLEYEIWLRGALERARTEARDLEPLVFINAWNEWGEGTYLEPDQANGHSYLVATRRALAHRTDWRRIIAQLRAGKEVSAAEAARYVDDLEFALERQERSLSYLAHQEELHHRLSLHLNAIAFSPTLPRRMQEVPRGRPGYFFIDRLNNRQMATVSRLKREEDALLVGWACTVGVEPTAYNAESYLTLFEMGSGGAYFAPIVKWERRQDVMEAHPEIDRAFTEFSGFRLLVSLADVPPGEYRIGLAQVNDSLSALTYGSGRIILA